jgi:amino acid adenylation domain-containing protein
MAVQDLIQEHSVASSAAGHAGLDVEDVTRLPLSFAQERLWDLVRREPNAPAHNIPVVLRLHGHLDVEALEQALEEFVQRHQVLRTRFRIRDGKPEQRLVTTQRMPLLVFDLSLNSDPEAEARRRVRQELQWPFELTGDALLRACVLKLRQDDHVLVCIAHHIVFDKWSRVVMLRELPILYEAALAGKPAQVPASRAGFSHGSSPSLPKLWIQYADFSQQRLQGGELERQLSYWKRQLAGAPASIDLPTDRPRPEAQSFRGARETVEIPHPVVDRLQDISRRHGATLFMTLLAGFNVLISRYSGQDDLVVGTPVARWNHPQGDKLIGVFGDMLALRADVSGEPTFLELLSRVKETVSGAYAHQDVPFQCVLEELKPERDKSRNPLFQIVFALRVPINAREFPGLTVDDFDIENSTVKFDLSLDVIERANGLRATFSYNTDLFNPATIQRMMRNWLTLLDSIAAGPEQRITELQLLHAEERRRLLHDWNQTAAEYPNVCIHELFEQQVERTPSATAVIYEGEQVSYIELNKRANQLASHLRGMGVGPDAVVGVLMDRSIEMVVALLAILKAGGAYVPLDPLYPAERLKFMISDAEAKVVLTVEEFATLVPANLRTILLDSDYQWLASENDRNINSGVQPHNLVYILHTSGSTGRPKGAMLPHAGIVNCLFWMQERYKLDETDAFLLKTSLNFDPHVWEIFWPLMVGASIVVLRPGGHLDSEYLIETIVKERVTSAYFVPSMLDVFLEAAQLNQVSSLRRVISGGEKLAQKAIISFFERLPGVELHHSYGPTETSIAATEWTCERDYPGGVVPMGRPLGNTKLYVLDQWMQPVPFGVAGELYIGGAGVGLGYAGRPDLTAERFLPNPFGASDERMYRTGDRVRYLVDGNIEFLGRFDDQLKIRGIRVEPAEIEAQIRLCSGVRQATVLAREDTPGNKRLVAYIVLDGDQVVQPSGMRRELLQKLPEHMIPSAFVFMDSLPLMPTGKVDRKALPVPDLAERDSECLPLRTPSEGVIAGIWAEVLKLETVGRQDHFLELGGRSINAVQVVSRIRQAFQVELSVQSLFENPTLSALAERVDALRQEASVSVEPRPATSNNELDRQGLPTAEDRASEPELELVAPLPAKQLALANRSLPSFSPSNSLHKSGLRRFLNRILHILCRVLPGATNLRPMLHRLRGVRIEGRVFIGDDVYIENEYPERVEIHDGATVGLRSTIVAHGPGSLARIVIGKNVFVGSRSTLVAPGNVTLTIGEGSVLMAGSVVTGDVSPLTVCGIEQAKPLARVTKPLTAKTSYEEFVTSLQPLSQ